MADSIEDDCVLRLVAEGHAQLWYDVWDGGLDGVELKLKRAGLDGHFNLDKKQSLEGVSFFIGFELDSQHFADTFVGSFLQLSCTSNGDEIGDQ